MASASAPPPIPPGVDITASKQPQLWAATIATFVLAVLAVAFRFWSRRLLKAKVWLDDWVILAATVSLQCKHLCLQDPHINRSISSCWQRDCLPAP